VKGGEGRRAGVSLHGRAVGAPHSPLPPPADTGARSHQ
jgi:hypothetical protein